MIPKNLNVFKGPCIAVSKDVRLLVNILSVYVYHTVNLEVTLIMPVPEMFAELPK